MSTEDHADILRKFIDGATPTHEQEKELLAHVDALLDTAKKGEAAVESAIRIFTNGMQGCEEYTTHVRSISLAEFLAEMEQKECEHCVAKQRDLLIAILAEGSPVRTVVQAMIGSSAEAHDAEMYDLAMSAEGAIREATASRGKMPS